LDGGHSQTCSPIVSIASGSGFVVMAFLSRRAEAEHRSRLLLADLKPSASYRPPP
jgi:hypothetical protein